MATANARSRPLLVASAWLFAGCYRGNMIEKQCRSQYPLPADATVVSDTTSIPPWQALPPYRPSDSLPQIYSADSSTAWFRSVFYADLGAFPGGERAVHSFLLRFHARLVGRTDTPGWYAVVVPDPGPDSTHFTLLQHCIGATYGVFVRSAFSRGLPPLFRDTGRHVLPNQRLKLPPPGLGRIPFVPQRTAVLTPTRRRARHLRRRSLAAIR